MKVDLAITGVGILSPAGHSALACMHAIRSETSALSMLPLPDRVHAWVAGGRIRKWTPYGGHRNWEIVAGDALQQAWSQANRVSLIGDESPVSVILGMPEALRPSHVFPRSDFDVANWAGEALARPVHDALLVQAGACSAQAGLRLAAQRLASGRDTACLVGAVDSQVQLRVTRWHEEHLRLKCSYLTDGLMPAEAAAFVLVEPLERAIQRGAAVLAIVDSVAGGQEAAHVLSDVPNTASGLTNAVAAALESAGIAPTELQMVWSDLNGESYKGREWAFVALRQGLHDETRLLHPADCHGDLGAATDAHLLGVAAMACATGWLTGRALIVSGSEGGVRAASVMRPGGMPTGFVGLSTTLPRVFSETYRIGSPPPTVRDFRETDDPPRYWFDWHVRQGHQDDIASLYYQREAMLHDPEVAWDRLGLPEERLLRHVDAVIASGHEAMSFLAAGIDSDEAGVAFGGSLLVGQIPSPENLELVARAIDGASGPRVEGIMAGLMHAPDSPLLRSAATHWLDSDSREVRRLALRIVAWHRLPLSLPRPVSDYVSSSAAALDLLGACWRLGWLDKVGELRLLLGHDDVEVRSAALMALACLIPDRAAMFCRARLLGDADFGGALALALAMVGDPRDATLLARRLDQAPEDLHVIEAMGLIGSVSEVPRLIELVDGSGSVVCAAAARAIEMMAGRAFLHRARAAGFNEPAMARRWWRDEGSKLDPCIRWRAGRAFDVAHCVRELAIGATPLRERRRAHREVVRWTRTRVAYEPEGFATLQVNTLKALS